MRRLAALLTLLSCLPKPESPRRGEFQEWLVVYSPELKRDLELLLDSLALVLNTPQPESLFVLVPLTPEELGPYKGYSNLIVLATSASASFKVYLKTFGEPKAGLSEARGKPWDGAYALGVYFPKEEALWASLPSLIKEIRGKMKARTLELAERLAYYAGHRKDISKEIAERWGVRLDVPEGWAYIKGLQRDDFFAMAKHNPDRFFFVWRSEGARNPSLEEVLDLRDSLTALYYEGDYALRDEVFVEPDTFAGHPALAVWGLWQNDKKVIGGPFKCFAFNSGGRFYLVDMAVFAPERRRKLRYILRMESFLRKGVYP